ncbi:MAG: EthD family reductase [Gammaproteobacteria bacterium]|nr:EthD family reductase [Gammaproteobacteria bacterium]
MEQMIKVVVLFSRKSGMDREAFGRHWQTTHAALVSKLPGLKRYVQSQTLASGYKRGEPACDGMAELWFENTDGLRALKGGAELAAVHADEANFIDPVSRLEIVVEDQVIKAGTIPADGVKNVELVTKKAGMPVEDFHRYWTEVHGPLGAGIKQVRRYVQSHTRLAAYRSGRKPVLDGVALTWFDDTDAMRASAHSPEYTRVRADEDNFLTVPLDFIITKERVILE